MVGFALNDRLINYAAISVSGSVVKKTKEDQPVVFFHFIQRHKDQSINLPSDKTLGHATEKPTIL